MGKDTPVKIFDLKIFPEVFSDGDKLFIPLAVFEIWTNIYVFCDFFEVKKRWKYLKIGKVMNQKLISTPPDSFAEYST